ncbi:MAG: metallophosphoesterase [Thermoplasmata archaeon]|uniref:Metallophosphoesterase n=1 Tax=Candidatus Sysuiplasma superficiale TaxID=2823368 RepID=A0A8J8CDL1_9ARCH|nr:metallophosphoesterase [Candidatus Sysuiplasma superficiale]MBX8643752.1 metallophosphoesterase [Candidatus Sysuiplasma superficiale]MCL4346798.1 metallophosphoesterase [Candidatus Thermoplasmatota archaeon]MCL5437084.1 metallophosphoesterase [Candidatus Thermoplasmatota archaeon]
MGCLRNPDFEIEPIANHPALRVGSDDTLIVIADLHLGLSDEFESRGVYVGGQAESMLSEIKELASVSQHLVILGDLRHEFSAFHSASVIPSFMSELLDHYSTIDLVPGNHDGLIIRQLPQRVRVHPSSGFNAGCVSFSHGHTWPTDAMMKGRYLLMGHIHPAVEFVDSRGRSYVEKCWFRVPFRRRDPTGRYGTLPQEAVVIPAFNPLLNGTPLNRHGDRGLGPVFRNRLVFPERGRLYLLDGTYLGPLKSNMPVAKSNKGVGSG